MRRDCYSSRLYILIQKGESNCCDIQNSPTKMVIYIQHHALKVIAGRAQQWRAVLQIYDRKSAHAQRLLLFTLCVYIYLYIGALALTGVLLGAFVCHTNRLFVFFFFNLCKCHSLYAHPSTWIYNFFSSKDSLSPLLPREWVYCQFVFSYFFFM